MMIDIKLFGNYKIVTTWKNNKIVKIEKYELINGEFVLIEEEERKWLPEEN